MIGRVVGITTALIGLAGSAAAQLISIRTVPVAQADQFEIFPSNNLGMGGVTIALADTLLDPFVNPAKGSRIAAARLFGSPSVFSVSQESGGGRTLPVAAVGRSGTWYGGVSLALQEVDGSRQAFAPQPPIRAFLEQSLAPTILPAETPEPRSRGNRYAFAMAGRELASGLSVGGSAFWAELHGVDGVDLLYAGSVGVEQYGHAMDVRLGLTKDWSGDRSLEAVVVHNRWDMAHDVSYAEIFWDPGSQQFAQRTRLERNLDRTSIWGLHLEYERPLGQTGWRVGWLATVNRMSHPKIPNYEIMSIPRDPGHSNAFNLGVGLTRSGQGATFAVDAIYEPIWSNTWADAEAPIQTLTGTWIPAGGKTIENDFRFSNLLVRMGVSEALSTSVDLQLGLVVRSIQYRMKQDNNVVGTSRRLDEGWNEWTPTWGLNVRFPELELRYRGQVTNGTGRPGVSPSGSVVLDATRVNTNILAAPSGPLTLGAVAVTSHQFSISVPLR